MPKIIGYYKMNTSKQINKMRDTKGARLWQKNYYDEIIRNPNHFVNFRKYIQDNPMNWRDDENNHDT